MQKILMKFDPATGKERPYPSHAAQWRNWHGVAAWLFDPWTGKRRNAYDVGSDVHGLLIVPAGTLGGDTGCGASKQNKHEAGNDAQWPEPLWWEVSMDDNYCTPLAAILRKAQGCIYRGTDEFIDVGGEVSELRRICDSQRATISRLHAVLTAAAEQRQYLNSPYDTGWQDAIRWINQQIDDTAMAGGAK